MIFVSVTRLRLRKLRFLPAFAWLAVRSTLQSRRAEGNLRTVTLKDRGLVFWTITLWQDQTAMRAFRNSGVHQAAMPRLFAWCDEATYCHWEQADAAVPDLKTAHARLVADGVVSRVKHPSGNHATRAFPAPKGRALDSSI
jgi:heme-degrading monooxygenase HmoA